MEGYMNPMNYSIPGVDAKRAAVMQAMCDLDTYIVENMLPIEEKHSFEGRSLYNSRLWLKHDIIRLLMTCEDVEASAKDVLEVISLNPCAEDIVKDFIHMDEIKEEVCIRSDFDLALSSVSEGAELAKRVGYSFSPEDIKTLALLHKEGKHRQKIEDLLEDANFHYECSRMHYGRYDELNV